ncbi:TPA: helix-turn-helix transcriptional regulator, partial [Staphylococcus pseudintermedius]|nr:helix-turn-helix transcriptional regulator [Staphylococcus pseudintermedius]
MKKSNIDKKKVGQRIKQIRKNAGLNLEEFGGIFSVSKSNVSKWENGANLPNNKRLKTIAELGNISVETL